VSLTLWAVLYRRWQSLHQRTNNSGRDWRRWITATVGVSVYFWRKPWKADIDLQPVTNNLYHIHCTCNIVGIACHSRHSGFTPIFLLHVFSFRRFLFCWSWFVSCAHWCLSLDCPLLITPSVISNVYCIVVDITTGVNRNHNIK